MAEIAYIHSTIQGMKQSPETEQGKGSMEHKLEAGRPGLDWLRSNAGVAMRAALLVLYLYLFFLGYLMMGVLGIFFITVLFLVALFSPVLYGTVIELWKKHSTQIMAGKK